MESADNYDFSIFKPRHLHGRKNRNVILTMLAIWAVAVFGFQIMLRILEKPTPEKSLALFESSWPAVLSGSAGEADYQSLLRSLALVRGKNTVKPADQELINNAISNLIFRILPDTDKEVLKNGLGEIADLSARLGKAKETEFLEIRSEIARRYVMIAELTGKYTGLDPESLEETIIVRSIDNEFPASLTDSSFEQLPAIMALYLTHNQSVLTDTKFAGFPFHYFYTAFFLLVLFIVLCIVYNILTERRLRLERVVE